MHDNYIRVDLKWVPKKRNGQDEDNAQVQQVPLFPDCYLAYEIYIGTDFKQPARIEIKTPLSHCITTKSFVPCLIFPQMKPKLLLKPAYVSIVSIAVSEGNFEMKNFTLFVFTMHLLFRGSLKASISASTLSPEEP